MCNVAHAYPTDSLEESDREASDELKYHSWQRESKSVLHHLRFMYINSKFGKKSVTAEVPMIEGELRAEMRCLESLDRLKLRWGKMHAARQKECIS